MNGTGPLSNMENITTYPTTANDTETDSFIFWLNSVTVPLVFGIITLIGVVGNTLVIYVIFSRKKMRTVTNFLLLNLAFADLSFVLICPPFTAYSLAMAAWPFGDVACRLMHYLLNVTAYVTVYTLVLISIIRYMTVCHNTQTMHIRTKKNVVFMVVGIWTLFLLLNIPIINSYGLHEWDGDLQCDNNSIMVGRALYTTFFIFSYLLPLLAIAVLSICILKHIQKQKTTILSKRSGSKSESRKRQASRVLILVVVIFALFWLPAQLNLLVFYNVMYYTNTFTEHRLYFAASAFFNCLAYFNSCVNPIIYNYASKDFRDSFREVIFCGRSGRDHENATVIKRLTPERNGTGEAGKDAGQDNHLLSDDETKPIKSADV